MPKTRKELSSDVPEASPKPELGKAHRHSLQPRSGIELPLSSLRHTQSHRYGADGQKSRKKVTVLPPIPPTIVDVPEDEEPGETRDKKARAPKKISTADRITIKATLAYDNGAYDGISERGSGSIRAGSSRASSVQSLEVVREQYCCCVRRTKCEKKLLLTVTIMSIVIIVLIIVIAIMGSRNIGEGLKHAFRLK